MSEIILTWLNEELQLSKRITSFEADFTNGYYFGEILARYNQQLNFSEFVNKDDKDSRLKNFTLLFDTFRSLRIGFDSNIVGQIIDGKEGVSKKILYELKMQLQKSATNYFSKLPKSSLTPLKKVQIGKEKKDSVDAEFFRKRLQQTHRAQKKINEENVMKKFIDFHQTQIEKSKEQQHQQQMQALQARDAQRQKLRATLKRATEFRNEWDKSNAEKWSKNMEIRRTNHEGDVLYKTKIQTLKRKAESAKEDKALKEVTDEIQEFQRKILKKESEDEPPRQLAKQQSVSPQKQTMRGTGLSAVNTGTLRVKKNPEAEEASRRQRDKRRRKMIVDLSKQQNLIQIEKRQQQILYNLNQTSKQEKEIQYEIWRAWQNKQIIEENRKLRDSKYAEKAQQRQTNARFKDEQLLRTYREEHKEDVNCRMVRQRELASLARVRSRQQIYDQCRDMVEQMLKISEECYERQQNSNTSDIHGQFLGQLLQQFQDQTTTGRELAEQQMRDYIDGRNVWAMTIQREPSQPQQPQKDNAIPSTAINNYYLGNILKTVFTKQLSDKLQKAEEVEGGSKMGICLLGLQFAGKKSIAEALSKQLNLKQILVENLIQERLNTTEAYSDTTQKLKDICSIGDDLPDDLVVDLVVQEINKAGRFILIDFPHTYEQGLALTKKLKGVEPQDLQSSSELNKKIEEFSRLVRPTETQLVERKMKPCGIDLVIWLDISQKESLNRCIGLRKQNNHLIHIDGEITDVNKLELSDRGAHIVEKNNFKRQHYDQVKNWFSNFGIAIEGGEKDGYRFQCWHEVPAEKQQKAVKADVTELASKLTEYLKALEEQKQSRRQEEEKKAKQLEQQKKAQEEIKNKCVLTNGEQLQKKLASALGDTPINPTFLQSCTEIWNKVQQSTIESYLRCFEGMREQRESIIRNLASLKRRFISQLVRPDGKFSLTKQFQLDYNQFVGQNKDMLENEQTREELHQRIQDLEDKLLEVVETKRDDAAEERNQVMSSGQLQSQLEIYYQYLQILVQAELERSLTSQQIIADYYTVAYNLEVKEQPEFSTDMSVQATLQIITNEFETPKVDKLLSQAIRVFNRQEAEAAPDDKNKKGGKGVPPPKKDDKKQAKKGGKEEPEEKKEPTPQELEMQSAINTQKAIFRYRLNLLKQLAKNELKQLKLQAVDFYGSLDQLLKYTFEVESEAVRKLTKLFHKKVEEQNKIQQEIQINYVDVIVSERILNYKNPPPKIQPARQVSSPNHFTISQLEIILRNLAAEAEKMQGRLAIRRLLPILTRLTENKQSSIMFPSSWRQLTFQDYERLASKLDHNGYILLRELFTLFILTDCQIPTASQLTKYRKDLNAASGSSSSINVKQFQSVESWFDKSQAQPRHQNTNWFDRSWHLKRLLFETLSTEQQLSIDVLLECLTMRSLKAKQGTTYFEAAFS